MTRRQQECDNCENLEKELHDYKSTIKTLRKRIRNLEKDLIAYTQLVSKDIEREGEPSLRRTCPSCKQGNLTLTDLTIKFLETCDICKYRRTIKKS